MDGKLTSQLSSNKLSVDTLLQMLTYCEGEIQARDIMIASLKADKTKQLWYEAKYGQLAGCNPIKALQRDSSYLDDENEVDEITVGQMYETQLLQLERLISVQRRCHIKSKQILAAAERRHGRILRELGEEKQRTAADAAQGDDLCALLENERTRLKQQLEYEQRENDEIRKEVEKLEKKLLNEKERHKSMVLFLINERKQMLLGLHELKVQSECETTHLREGTLITEMKKEISSLRSERDQLRIALETTKTETQNCKEIIRNQEGLAFMRNSILTNTRNYNNNMKVSGDGCVVVVNKAVSTATSPSKTFATGAVSANERYVMRPRLCNSSTFPAGERYTPSRVPLPTSSRLSSSTIPLSPAKKGISYHSTADRPTTLSGVRTNAGTVTRERITNSSESPDRIRNAYAAEPEIEQLNAVIESMISVNKRSASLPRNGKNKGAIGSQQKTTVPKNNSTVKRCTIFKTLGVTTRNNVNGI